MEKKISNEDILVTAFLKNSNITEISKQTGISRNAIYRSLRKDSFKEKLQEARRQAVGDTIGYLQGSMAECAETLMEIVRDKKSPPQCRINACNAVFQTVKSLAGDNDKLAEMAVTVYDTI